MHILAPWYCACRWNTAPHHASWARCLATWVSEVFPCSTPADARKGSRCRTKVVRLAPSPLGPVAAPATAHESRSQVPPARPQRIQPGCSGHALIHIGVACYPWQVKLARNPGPASHRVNDVDGWRSAGRAPSKLGIRGRRSVLTPRSQSTQSTSLFRSSASWSSRDSLLNNLASALCLCTTASQHSCRTQLVVFERSSPCEIVGY